MKLPRYDGTKVPDDHLRVFQACMQIANLSEGKKCKLFPTTLSGEGLMFFKTYQRRNSTDHSRQDKGMRPQHDKGGGKPSIVPRGRFQTYTVLTVSISRIMADLEDLEILPVMTPRKPRPSDNAKDQTRYCQYHRDYGHSTGECISLKDEIETLI